MAVCNIFEPLKKETGTFLTFSQYTEDLTREHAEGREYRVVPSMFIAFDIDYSDQVKFTNGLITTYLQHNFENGCAIYRKEMGNDWTPEFSKNLFWGMFFDKFSSKQDLRYIGDINLQSYNEWDGMGYSEIYCYIPNEGCEMKCDMVCSNGFETKTISNGSTIEGYTPDEIGGRAVLVEDVTYKVKDTYKFENITNVVSKSFNINTIVLLYDVYTGDEKLYDGIPLGIYFTGLIDGGMTNQITKYVSNEDIYNSGTSYGLRVCSRFTANPTNGNLTIQNVTMEDNSYSELSRVLSQISISQNKMDEILDRNYIETQNYKDLLAIFKNSRTNVPYIRKVNGEDVWFVNGRMLNSTAIDNDCECMPYTDAEMDEFINDEYTLNVQVVAKDVDGNKVFIIGSNPTVYINWKTMYMGDEIIPDKVGLNMNGEEVNPDSKFSAITKVNLNEAGDYVIGVDIEKWGKASAGETSIKFVNPTYFGSVDSTTPSLSDITNLAQYADASKESQKQYYTKDPKHICLAYPKEYGTLMSIQDSYGYEYLDKTEPDFTYDEISINGADYYVYVDMQKSASEKLQLIIR